MSDDKKPRTLAQTLVLLALPVVLTFALNEARELVFQSSTYSTHSTSAQRIRVNSETRMSLTLTKEWQRIDVPDGKIISIARDDRSVPIEIMDDTGKVYSLAAFGSPINLSSETGYQKYRIHPDAEVTSTKLWYWFGPR